MVFSRPRPRCRTTAGKLSDNRGIVVQQQCLWRPYLVSNSLLSMEEGLIRPKSLVHALADGIQARLEAGEWQRGQRLPSEPALARALQVSRSTLREALRLLEDRRLIERRHGLGSFVTVNSGHIVAGLGTLESYVTTISRCGFQAEDRVIRIDGGVVEPETGRLLALSDGSLGWTVHSLRLADGLPVIYCRDVIPAVLVPDRLTMQKRVSKPLLDFFREELGNRPQYAFLTIGAALPDGDIIEQLHCTADEPLVTLTGIAFDGTDRPLYYHHAYIRSQHIDLTLVRR